MSSSIKLSFDISLAYNGSFIRNINTWIKMLCHVGLWHMLCEPIVFQFFREIKPVEKKYFGAWTHNNIPIY